MNYPNALPIAILCLVFISSGFASCGADDPAKDDSSKPADGDTGDGAAECVDEDKRIAGLEADVAKLEAELAACAPTPEPAPK